MFDAFDKYSITCFNPLMRKPRFIKRQTRGRPPHDTPLERARLGAGLTVKEAAALSKKLIGRGSMRSWSIWAKPGAKVPAVLIERLRQLAR